MKFGKHMKTIKLSQDEESALREVIRMAGKHLDMGDGQNHLETILLQIDQADDKPTLPEQVCCSGSYTPEPRPFVIPPTEIFAIDSDMSDCEQCEERAWDGYICHACGMKHI